MIYEAFLRLVDGIVDGFKNWQIVGNQVAGLILLIFVFLDIFLEIRQLTFDIIKIYVGEILRRANPKVKLENTVAILQQGGYSPLCYSEIGFRLLGDQLMIRRSKLIHGISLHFF